MRALALPERHLGLVQARETGDLEARLDRLADLAESGLDLDAILARGVRCRPAGRSYALPRPPGQRIAIASDAAFWFLYPHLETDGAGRAPNSLRSRPWPTSRRRSDCDVCWLPGGYPELHAGHPGGGRPFPRRVCGLRRTRPVHGECGGYMVLGESLEDADGITHPMAALLPVATSYRARRLHLGYRVATLVADGVLGRAGARLVGHEFHYASERTDPPVHDIALAAVTDAEGTPQGLAGHRGGNVTGSFFHLIAG